jgi:ammonium transporter Rh
MSSEFPSGVGSKPTSEQHAPNFYHLEQAHVSWKHSANLLLALQVFLLILFARCSQFNLTDSSSAGTITQGYFYFLGIEIMMFIGFGYLMTFMKTYGLGAVGFTMLLTAISIQWYPFCESFFHQIYNNYNYPEQHRWHFVDIDIYSLMNSLFGVSAVLISFGAVIGKIKPTQLIIMAIMELVFHAFNYEVILVGAIKVADIGGTYADHMFGAYFGLAVAMVLTSSDEMYHQRASPATGYAFDLFSLIGTLFLWIYWPSFVGGGLEADSAQQQRAVVNTILSLSASTIITFYLSSMLNPLANRHVNHYQFRPVDIQNATLAGGVAIGSTANLNMNPVNAVFIGLAAGALSTAGYNFIQPYLQEKWKLHDTCGVHNLHAMPSLVGAIASVILAGYKQAEGRDHDADVYAMYGASWRQAVGMVLCILCAIITGAFTGYVIQFVDPIFAERDKPFDDASYWEVATGYDYQLNLAEESHDLGDSVHSVVGTHYVRGGAMRGAAANTDGSVAGSVHGASAHGGSVSGSNHGDIELRHKVMDMLNE